MAGRTSEVDLPLPSASARTACILAWTGISGLGARVAFGDFGMGARLGVPVVSSARASALRALRRAARRHDSELLLNPALFLHEGRAPNGASPGSFIGFVQGLGLLIEDEQVSWTPAVALVAGRAQRNSYGQQYGPVRSVLGLPHSASPSPSARRRSGERVGGEGGTVALLGRLHAQSGTAAMSWRLPLSSRVGNSAHPRRMSARSA